MIEVRLTLYDPTELAAIQQVYTALLTRRMNILAAQAPAAPAPEPAPEKPEPVTVTSENFGELLVQSAEEAVAIHEGRMEPAKVVSVPAPEPLTTRDIFKQYLDAHGFAAARKKLDAFGLQRIGDLKPEDAPAFLASLSAPA